MANFLFDDFKRIFTGDNPLSKIIVLNVIVFVFTSLFNQWIPLIEHFAIPGDISAYFFQFWSVVTYMFLHSTNGISHILFNMLILYSIGKIALEFLGPRRFTAIYFTGGIAGGLLYLVSFNLLAAMGVYPFGGLLLGASAAVMAIVVATATLLPDYKINLIFFGPVPLKYVALTIFILSSVLNFSFNTGGKLAHIGGAALGFLFIRNLQSGKDWSIPFYSFLFAIRNPFVKKKMRVVSNKNRAPRSAPTYTSNAPNGASTKTKNQMDENQKQQKVDAILDKIGKSGYDSLTESEKEFLFKVSGK